MNPILVEASIRSELENHLNTMSYIQGIVENITSSIVTTDKISELFESVMMRRFNNNYVYCIKVTILLRAFEKNISKNLTIIRDGNEVCYVDALIKIKEETKKENGLSIK